MATQKLKGLWIPVEILLNEDKIIEEAEKYQKERDTIITDNENCIIK